MKNYLIYIYLNLISLICLLLIIFISIAFLTLLERKMLSYIQNRKGPNKVGFMGILQPFSEAIKLFSKEIILILKSNFILFYLAPIFSMLMLMMLWINYYYFMNIYYLNYSILLIILILSMNSYFIMTMGWASNSLYSMIGSIRSVAQVLSYEVSFIMIILIQMLLSESYSLMDLMKWQKFIWFLWMLYPLMIIFFISMLAELNRSPMDFIEGESELVSGFNVEYFSGSFALIFLSEYGMIIFSSYFITMMFMGSMKLIMNLIIMNLMISLIIFMRGILPRMRYDELMYLSWKIILPLVLNYLFFFFFFKEFFMLLL